MGYKFYIQKATKSAGPDGDVIDIEKHFKGLHYLSCKGLETKGPDLQDPGVWNSRNSTSPFTIHTHG